MTSSSKIHGLYTVNRVLNSKTHYLETHWKKKFWIFFCLKIFSPKIDKIHEFSKFFEFSNKNLIINFWAFTFVYGAKVIYFSWRIQIREKIWRARTSARAARLWKCLKIPKNGFFTLFFPISPNFRRAPKIFFGFEISINFRWLLHHKRILKLKNSQLNLNF